MNARVQCILNLMLAVFGPRVFLVLLIIGGSKAELMKLHARRPRTQVFVLDNPNDLEKLKVLCKHLSATTIPLGRAQTAASLASQLGKEYEEPVSKFAPTDAKSGFGAAPLIGYMSALVTLAATWFDALLGKLVGAIRAATNNAPDFVVVRVLGSVDGGTCSGYFRPTIDRFVRTLVRLGVHVQVEMDFVGPNGFAHLDPRITQIASAVIPFAVASTMQAPSKQELLVTKHLTLGELPPGCSEEERYELALTEEAAVTSSDMVRHTHRIRPNHGTTSVYGNVTLRETDFFKGLNLTQQILPQIAEKLSSQLSEAKAKVIVDTSLIKEIDFTERTLRNKVRDVESVCNEIFTRPAKELAGIIEKPLLQHQSTIHFTLVDGIHFTDGGLDSICTTSNTKLSKAIERATLVTTVTHKLAEEQRALGATSRQATEELDTLRQKFFSVVNLISSQEHSRKKGDQLFTLLVETAQSMRRLADEIDLYDSRSRVVAKTLSKLQLDQELIEREFETLADALALFQADAVQTAAQPSIEVCDLEEAFEELMCSAPHGKGLFGEALRWCINNVTKYGLAEIVSAKLPTANAIADQIVFGTPHHEGSPYGGLVSDDVPNTIYVLPPVNDNLKSELRSEIEKRDPNAETFFMDTAAVGANVLRFRFRFPKSIQEIMHGTLMHELKEVLNLPTHQNFFPGETDYVARAGLLIEGNDFKLVNQSSL
jgi:hypothetical protein